MDVAWFLETYRAEITSVALPLAGGYIKHSLSPKSKIVYSKSHGFCYTLKSTEGNSNLVYTESYFFQNKGRKTAEEVEIILGRKPQNFAIWPQRDYTTNENEEGFFVIKTSNLSKNEHFTLNMLEINFQPPMVTNVRSTEGISKLINMAPLQIFPKWFNASAAILLFLGACSAMYLSIRFLELVIS